MDTKKYDFYLIALIILIVILSTMSITSCATPQIKPVPVVSVPMIYPCPSLHMATIDTFAEVMQYNALQYKLCQAQVNALIEWKHQIEGMK